ncbi:uncharacterized protein TRAVEDRAFT_32316 [Trametes versicolor FP-101664 SS1]|uniref:Uncharacterized protein n=1 Tax=Trametes versicolor (strain FP-101664) TaxID=717944 RepID=R7S7B4_TRAVS|nr:uncharacterized protein TRAVEDRAFT_32316 [Trametes versicolor FP-101664 SS1]EIW51856.1 hypothetical protein TRAVEDRAFT_32316 [Trametes versicolor FP-101664 SS1]
MVRVETPKAQSNFCYDVISMLLLMGRDHANLGEGQRARHEPATRVLTLVRAKLNTPHDIAESPDGRDSCPAERVPVTEATSGGPIS